MALITILGGTGYTGSNIARVAAERGHEVVAVARHAPAERLPGVRYEQAALTDTGPLVAASDVAVAAVSPRGETAGTLLAGYRALADRAAGSGARLVVIGGFSSLRPAPGVPRFAEGDRIPEEFAAEAHEMTAVLQALQDDAPEALDWLFVSPAQTYGAFTPGDVRGSYRIGGEVALVDAGGASAIGGVDFATAIVDEIERPAHHRTQISVAY